jgi:hypothetical protein
MSDTNTQNVDQQNDNQQEENNTSQDNQDQQNEDPVQKLVKDKVTEAIKDIKSKLDNAYSARDDALRKLAELEQAKKEAELQRLKDEGKHKEVLELQLAEERTKREALEKRTIELTRDLDLRNALSGYEFRNDSATEMAYREIVGQLVQNEQGVWVHKSGVPMRDFVKQFAESENNSFLLKPKVSTGSGSSSVKNTNTSDNEKKSVFSMSQEEVLKLAREGKLPSRK